MTPRFQVTGNAASGANHRNSTTVTAMENSDRDQRIARMVDTEIHVGEHERPEHDAGHRQSDAAAPTGGNQDIRHRQEGHAESGHRKRWM